MTTLVGYEIERRHKEEEEEEEENVKYKIKNLLS